jgi:ribosomal protein L37E
MSETSPFTDILRDMAQHKRRADRRRAALVEYGCATYWLVHREKRPAIRCLCCGIDSYNPTDIAEKFCGFCDAWHTDWQEGTP